jgi:hypothetical protein
MSYALQHGPCGDYQLFADANVTTWLIATGLMESAPVAPAATAGRDWTSGDDREWTGDEDRGWENDS